jgi:hypothetical protein
MMFSASTIGVEAGTPAVSDVPVKVAESAPEVTVNVDWNSRLCVEAATVMTHGPWWSVVPAPGPLLRQRPPR